MEGFKVPANTRQDEFLTGGTGLSPVDRVGAFSHNASERVGRFVAVADGGEVRQRRGGNQATIHEPQQASSDEQPFARSQAIGRKRLVCRREPVGVAGVALVVPSCVNESRNLNGCGQLVTGGLHLARSGQMVQNLGDVEVIIEKRPEVLVVGQREGDETGVVEHLSEALNLAPQPRCDSLVDGPGAR